MSDQETGPSYYYVAIIGGALLGIALATFRLILDSEMEAAATLKAIYVLVRDRRRDENEAHPPAESLEDLIISGDSAGRGEHAP